ncbi:hypothetical protein L596_007433 [Steinernema carpocapsae]|uniref:Uncharacterized protein n=1 Tax=Steinernema carpocapsae TaxID=34508 RepID=A0A4U5PAA5_STECR|nr:hypothetical protein L596_007433 [Steinernema carpocapsae]
MFINLFHKRTFTYGFFPQLIPCFPGCNSCDARCGSSLNDFSYVDWRPTPDKLGDSGFAKVSIGVKCAFCVPIEIWRSHVKNECYGNGYSVICEYPSLVFVMRFMMGFPPTEVDQNPTCFVEALQLVDHLDIPHYAHVMEMLGIQFFLNSKQNTKGCLCKAFKRIDPNKHQRFFAHVIRSMASDD